MDTYFKALSEVITTKSCRNNRAVSLDFSNPADYDCFCKMLGGETDFKEEFPYLFDITQNSISYYKNNSVRQACEFEHGFTNVIYINDCSYNKTKKELYAFGNVFLTNRIKRIFVTLTIKNKNSKNEDQIIGFNKLYGNNCTKISIDCNIQNLELADYNVSVIIHATWEDASNLLTSYVAEKTLSCSLTEIIEKINVNDPRHKNSPENEDINVCYARQPAAVEKIDYTYPEERTAQGHQKMFLDISGNASLIKQYTFLRVVPRTLNIILNCDGAGGIFYSANEPEKYISAKDNGFQWEFPKDWDNYIQESVQYGNRQYQFDMEFQFYIKENSNKYAVTVSSYENPQTSSHYRKISNIHLWWGCVAEDTKVLMANNTQKKIQEIKLGDSIITNTSGSTAVVTNIWTGTDENIYCVCCDNNTQIYATRYHPFVTREGQKPVIKLKDTDELLMTDGYHLIKYAYPVKGKMKVYNLVLNTDAHTMICNNYVIGDHNAQGKIIEQLNNDNEMYFEPDENDPVEIESKKLLERLSFLKAKIEKEQRNEEY